MIKLSADALEVLEKVCSAENEFLSFFKALSIAASEGVLLIPPNKILRVHSGLLLHIIANLVEAQTEIKQLKGQIAILKVDKEDKSDVNGTNAKDN